MLLGGYSKIANECHIARSSVAKAVKSLQEKQILKVQHILCQNKFDNKPITLPTIAEIENSRFQLDAFDDVLIRKLIECVKVISKTKIIIIFKGGYEVKAEVEKK